MKTIYYIMLCLFLGACSPIKKPKENNYKNRTGEVVKITLPEDLVKEISLGSLLDNCKPEIAVEQNVIDMAFSIVGAKNPLLKVRHCLEAKLEDSSGRICKAHEKLQIQLRKTDDTIEKQRINAAINKLKNIEDRFNRNWGKLASNFDRYTGKLDSKSNKGGLVKKGISGFFSTETESLGDIFDQASRSDCFSNENADNNNRNADRSNNLRQSRERDYGG